MENNIYYCIVLNIPTSYEAPRNYIFELPKALPIKEREEKIESVIESIKQIGEFEFHKFEPFDDIDQLKQAANAKIREFDIAFTKRLRDGQIAMPDEDFEYEEEPRNIYVAFGKGNVEYYAECPTSWLYAFMQYTNYTPLQQTTPLTNVGNEFYKVRLCNDQELAIAKFDHKIYNLLGFNIIGERLNQ